MLCKKFTDPFEMSIIVKLFENKINYVTIMKFQSIINLKRPLRLFSDPLGILVQTIDNEYPEYIILKHNFNIFRIVLSKPITENEYNFHYKYLEEYVNFDVNFISKKI
tara:strand:+ start:16590 stop:16913 length:324 start_codon:yes stop_codon:yes gene_type:complete